MSKKSLQYLRWLNNLEGCSLLFLLFIAMPYRAWSGNHQPVSTTGSLHGFLFLMYTYTLWTESREQSWPWKKTLKLWLLASVPFGFLMQKNLISKK